MLNPEFARVGWRPDPAVRYQCVPRYEAMQGFTYLMALVLSGRNSDHPHQLARQDELDVLLASPESGVACRQVNVAGMTALMMAACCAGTDSTEATVAQLLAHESSGEVAHMQSALGWTALMLAARYSGTCSTDATVAMLLAHESGRDTAHLTDFNGWTALMWAAKETSGSSSSEAVARVRNVYGWTALTLPAQHGTEAAVEQLLMHESGREMALAAFPLSSLQDAASECRSATRAVRRLATEC
jgi:ankyrin repeat protein